MTWVSSLYLNIINIYISIFLFWTWNEFDKIRYKKQDMRCSRNSREILLKCFLTFYSMYWFSNKLLHKTVLPLSPYLCSTCDSRSLLSWQRNRVVCLLELKKRSAAMALRHNCHTPYSSALLLDLWGWRTHNASSNLP